MQKNMYDAAKQRLKANTVLANSIEEVESLLKDVTAEKGGGKFVMAHMKDDPRCDARMKEFKATIRCIPSVDEYDGPGKCIVTGETGGSAGSDREGVLTTRGTETQRFFEFPVASCRRALSTNWRIHDLNFSVSPCLCGETI